MKICRGVIYQAPRLQGFGALRRELCSSLHRPRTRPCGGRAREVGSEASLLSAESE